MNDQTNPFHAPAPLQPYGVESSVTAAAAEARALVEARYVMALRLPPRDWDDVRQRVLRECRRPAFARNKSALYHKPIGKGVEGLGVRFVEVALRCMGKVMIEQSLTFEDATKEIVRVTVTDLESTLTYWLDVKVTKTVERSKPSDDGSYISMRRNSYGSMVYTVPAADDDLLNKRNALISKALRALGLRLIPGDLQDEGEAAIRAVRLDDAAKDPDAERKSIADAFGALGVRVAQLGEYIGHDIGTCSPAELVELRGLYGAIRDGEATWASAMESKRGEPSGDDGAGDDGSGSSAGAKPPPASGGVAEKVKDRLRQRREEKGASRGANPPAAPPATPTGAAAGPGEASAAPPPAAGPAEPDLLGDQQEQQRPAGAAPSGQSAALLRAQLMAAADEDAANLVIDRARHLPKEDYDGLVSLLESRFPRE